MGIGTSVALKIGIPIAIISAVGLGLFAFRTQIVGAVRGGAQTLGQIVTEPIGGFFQGIQTGLESIPTTIDFSFPTFTFGGGGSPPPPPATNGGGGSILDDITNFFDDLFNGNVDVPPIDEELSGELTQLPGDIRFDTGSFGNVGGAMSGTVEEILAGNVEALGLFDFLGTEKTEFIPLSQSQLEFIGAENVEFSGQLFEEIASEQDVINFQGGA